MSGDYPDPSVIRVGKDYWATATSSEWGPQFPILHSTDLVNWEITGTVFPASAGMGEGKFLGPGNHRIPRKVLHLLCGPQKGGPLAVAVATADKPSGPYTDHGPLVAQELAPLIPCPSMMKTGSVI